MKTIKMKNLTRAVSSELGYPKKQVEWTLEVLFEKIEEELLNDNKVIIPLGTFTLKRKTRSKYYNIHKKKMQTSRAKRVLSFHRSRKYKSLRK